MPTDLYINMHLDTDGFTDAVKRAIRKAVAETLNDLDKFVTLETAPQEPAYCARKCGRAVRVGQTVCDSCTQERPTFERMRRAASGEPQEPANPAETSNPDEPKYRTHNQPYCGVSRPKHGPPS